MDEKNVKKLMNEEEPTQDREDKSKYESYVGENISFDPNDEFSEESDDIDSDLVHFDIDSESEVEVKEKEKNIL